MKNFLIESITYKTTLKEDEIIAKLKKLIDPYYDDNLEINYQGEIDGQTFRLWDSDTFSLKLKLRLYIVIDGVIEKEHNGTILIKTSTRPNMFYFSLMFIASSIALGFVLIQDFSRPDPWMWVAVFVLFFSVVSVFDLKSASNTSRKELKRIFKAEIIEESPQQ